MTSVKDRFLKYVAIDTQSAYDQEAIPSTKKQFDLAKLLVKELEELGLKDVQLDEHCYVMATLPSNTSKKLPVIGLIAHMDTSPDSGGAHVNPRIIPEYDGKEILLNKKLNLRMNLADFPELKKYIGQELIVTDGNTLLGADDKAGIAAIMSVLETLALHPEIKHGTLKIGFTPDEEVGRGADLFDVKKFGADFAYTVDGGELGEMEYETFNAAELTIKVKGKNVHPGAAKDKMINSIHVAQEFDAMLPPNERPEYTTGYEGFYHLMRSSGDIESSQMVYIIRDHNRAIFEKRKQVMLSAAEHLNLRYGKGTVEVVIKDQYFNMREKLELKFEIVDLAKRAIVAVGIVPIITPVRGGTDGARLSFMGLPCPNLFAGGLYFHGRYECIPTRSLEKSVEVILKIIELSTEKPL
ncbi:MAG: peptidase T [Anaerolineaceae bacterium]